MYKSLSVLLVSSIVLTGCGESRLNPFNWFGRAEQVAAPDPNATVNPLIPRRRSVFSNAGPEDYAGELVAVVREMKVEQTPGGAILRVTGLAATQGAWDVRLVPLNEGEPLEGTLAFDLRALKSSAAVGGERTRTLTVASFVSEQTLAKTRNIQVNGLQNSLASRRR